MGGSQRQQYKDYRYRKTVLAVRMS